MNNRKITFLALLASATIVGRIFFQSLPNVQPVTAVLIFSTIYLGITEAMLLNIIIITISNIYLRFGVWTIYQIASYSTIILIASFLSYISIFKDKLLLQTIFSFLSGFIYGFIISILSALFFSKVSNFWVYYFYMGILLYISFGSC